MVNVSVCFCFLILILIKDSLMVKSYLFLIVIYGENWFVVKLFDV